MFVTVLEVYTNNWRAVDRKGGEKYRFASVQAALHYYTNPEFENTFGIRVQLVQETYSTTREYSW